MPFDPFATVLDGRGNMARDVLGDRLVRSYNRESRRGYSATA